MTNVTFPDGIEARSLRAQDADDWAGLLAAKEKVDSEGDNYTAEDLIHELSDPNLETVGLWDAGRLIAFGALHTATSVVDIDRVKTEGCVHPDWRRRGLGTTLMRWLTERARQLHLANHADTPGEVCNTTIGSNLHAIQILRTLGFDEQRYHFDMIRPLDTVVPELRAADHFKIVTFDPSFSEDLRNTHNQVIADIWGATAKDAASWQSEVTGIRSFRPELSQVAFSGNTIAAYVLGYEWDADTEITGVRELYIGQLGTKRSYRGRGLAKATLTKMLVEAAASGYQRVRLGVDADSPTGAVSLYTSLGFSLRSNWTTFSLPL
ncbi:GNAT family N-acetyltransferase [Kribbella ginsengisoli]